MTDGQRDKTDVTALVKYAKSLEAEIERLRAALKPLAAVKLWSDSYPDIKADFIAAAHLEVYFTVEDVKAARAACADEQREDTNG